MGRVRILHLITGLTVGGAEMMLYKLVSGMDRRRFENGVVTLWAGGELERPLREMGIALRSLPMRRGRPTASGVVAMVRLLRRERPDVLQTWLYHADLLGTLACAAGRLGAGWGGEKSGGPALVWNVRASNLVGPDPVAMTRWASRACAVLSRSPLGPRVIVANSESGRRAHEVLGYRARRWEVIPNGFDVERFRPDSNARHELRAALGIGEDAPVAGSLARYDPMKDHETLLRAAAAVRRLVPGAHFVLAGSGVDGDNAALAGLVRELGLGGSVHLLGQRADAPRVLAALDVLVSSSAYGEGFSNVIGEAMACAVPCVVTDVGDSAAIVGETGVVVPPRSAGALAEGMRRVLAMAPGERAALGRAARERVRERFSLAAVVARYERLYAELAAR